MMASQYGWSLEYIRNMSEKDYQMHYAMLEVFYRIEGAKNKRILEGGH